MSDFATTNLYQNEIFSRIVSNETTKNLLTFVTVSFSEELPSLLLQARSLVIHGCEVIGRWIIIFNEDLSAEREIEIIRAIEAEASGASFRVDFASRQKVTDIDLSSYPGSRSQQVLKLAISRFVEEDFYVVLDSKNHAIRLIEKSHFIENGRAKVHTQIYHKNNPFYKWFANAFNLVGLVIDEEVHKGYQSTTPYILITDIARECLRPENLRSELKWYEYIRLPSVAPNSVTEFALYSAMIHSKKATQKITVSARIYETLFPKSPFSETLKATTKDAIIFFGVHRLRIPELSLEEKRELSKAWVSFGLFSDEEKGIQFLESGSLAPY